MKIISSIPTIDLIKSKVDTIASTQEIGTSETSGRKGVNKSFKLTNTKGESFLFKPSSGEHTSRWRYVPANKQYLRERAAYLVDKQLGFGLVPKTKIVKYQNEIGSLHEWIDAEHNPDITLRKYSNDTIWKVGLLDLIIGNCDRHSGNQLDYDSTIVAIDHGYSFPERAESSDPRSVILSRFAYRIWGKAMPERYLTFLLPLKDINFQKHIRKLVGDEAFNLFKERVDTLLKGIAKFPKYKIVEKIKGIPLEKER